MSGKDKEMTLSQMGKVLREAFPTKEIKAAFAEGDRRVLQAVLQRTVQKEKN